MEYVNKKRTLFVVDQYGKKIYNNYIAVKIFIGAKIESKVLILDFNNR